MNSPDKHTFLIETLGCRANQYDTQAMRELLSRSGFRETRSETEADIFIINSCSVTHKADKGCRNRITHFKKINPKGKVAVAGCYAEFASDRKLLSVSGAHYLIKNSEKIKIADILKNTKISGSSRENFNISDFENRDKAFLKIQDGCDHKCSYCKVRLVRGRSKSRPEVDVMEECRRILKKGFKEITLTGICLGAWGMDIGKNERLCNIVSRILALPGDFRVRLSSIEPIYINDSLIKLIASNDKLCEHLHVPLQSGDDAVLKRMRRPYTTRSFQSIIARIRKNVPNAAFTTDVLAGFPGETEASFKKTLKFLKRVKPSRMHVFSYSRREGTEAAAYSDEIRPEVTKKRTRALNVLNKSLMDEFAKRFLNKKERVLIESDRDKKTGLLAGYTSFYVRVLVDGPDSLKNSMRNVLLKSPAPETGVLVGALVN